MFVDSMRALPASYTLMAVCGSLLLLSCGESEPSYDGLRESWHLKAAMTDWNGFEDNGDGTVTAHKKGLTWMKCAQGMT